MVPLVSVIALEDTPTVNVPTTCHVPPIPLNVIGKSSVLPLVVIVLVPLVAAKVIALAPPDIEGVVPLINRFP